MRQTLGEYEEYEGPIELHGEERGEETEGRRRRLPTVLLTLALMALFAGALWYAYIRGTHHAGPGGVPLIRADERPAKIKPDQPGGMAIPDQNISLYNDRRSTGPVEKLLPPPEQPMPRPVAAPPIPPAPPQEAAAPALPPVAPPP